MQTGEGESTLLNETTSDPGGRPVDPDAVAGRTDLLRDLGVTGNTRLTEVTISDRRHLDALAQLISVDLPAMLAEIRGYRDTTTRFTDPTVTEAFAREIRKIRHAPHRDCNNCREDDACSLHIAMALVDAIRAERLVVLTVDKANDIARDWRIRLMELGAELELARGGRPLHEVVQL